MCVSMGNQFPCMARPEGQSGQNLAVDVIILFATTVSFGPAKSTQADDSNTHASNDSECSTAEEMSLNVGHGSGASGVIFHFAIVATNLDDGFGSVDQSMVDVCRASYLDTGNRNCPHGQI